MDICPNCRKPMFDRSTLACDACGMTSMAIDEVTPMVLAGLTHNAQLQVEQLAPGTFQQVLGPLGPRVGAGRDDGVLFTAQTADAALRAFHAAGIIACRVAVHANNTTEWSILIAPDQAGLHRATASARKMARRHRAQIAVYDNPSTG